MASLRIPGLILAASLMVATARADVRVAVHDGRMDILATRVSIAEILDRVASQTGMKVIYDGPRPQKVITKSVLNWTPANAVLGILEGEGLNYAVILNPASTQVETLLLTGPSKVRPSLAPRPADVAPMAPGQADGWSVEVDEPPPPPPPAAPPTSDGEPAPDGQAPAQTGGGNNNNNSAPATLPTPPPPPSSPFTPQGPGPVLLQIPGATPMPPR
jgi:hypothetical protein